MARRSRQLTEYRPPTEQECRFAVEYLVDLDPKKAALRAGYDSQVAAGAATTLLREPQIMAEIDRVKESRAVRVGISIDRGLLEIARVATYDPADCFDDDGRPLSIHEMPEDTRRAISSFKVGADGSVEFKFVPKMDALKQFMDHVRPTPLGGSLGTTDRDQKLIALFYELFSNAAKRPLPPKIQTKVISSNANRDMIEVTIGDDDSEVNVTPPPVETPRG